MNDTSMSRHTPYAAAVGIPLPLLGHSLLRVVCQMNVVVKLAFNLQLP